MKKFWRDVYTVEVKSEDEAPAFMRAYHVTAGNAGEAEEKSLKLARADKITSPYASVVRFEFSVLVD